MKDFNRFMNASEDDRRSVFEDAAARIGVEAAHVEKDLWVCWTLDFIFNQRPDDSVRMFFKGGTSLSKGYGLINRFSEDIDIGVFKEDISAPDEEEISQLASVNKQYNNIVERIDGPSAEYFGEILKPMLERRLFELSDECGLPNDALKVYFDRDPRKGAELKEVILVEYPTLYPRAESYVRNVVRIEGGARPRHEPSEGRRIVPYVSKALPYDFDLSVEGVRVIRPERTFWEKVLILHAMRQMSDVREAADDPRRVVPSLERYSRHYYDVYMIMQSDEYGKLAIEDIDLAEECRDHKDLMFRAPDHRYDLAVPGKYTLAPSAQMMRKLEIDYDRMKSMIFLEVPALSEIIGTIEHLEARLNDPAVQHEPASDDTNALKP